MLAELSIVGLERSRQLRMRREDPAQANEGAHIAMFTWTARLLRKTDDNIAIPCSVKAHGR
ncbi:MAG: hypothetical protein HYR85_17250 [Planctomycetes bacterium]|nr:hypothetical protein [Planctomycetota bacterium]